MQYLSFYKFIYLCTLDNINETDLSDFICILAQLDNFFFHRTQQDAHEALLKIFSNFDSGISAITPQCSSMYNTYFQGFLKTYRTCTLCKKENLIFEPFYDIEVIPGCVLTKAIENSFKGIVQVYCTNCDYTCDHLSSSIIYDHPRVLLVLVKRYSLSSSHSTHKNTL